MVSIIRYVISFLLLSPVAAHAATYYVATTGNNGNSCAAAQTASTPKLTLSAGVSCLSGGDTLVIAAGTYTGQNILNPPAGTASAHTVIKGDRNGVRPIIAPAGGTMASPGQTGFDCTGGSACSYITLEYVEITGAYRHVRLYGSDAIGYPHHVHLIDNVLHDSVHTGVQILTSASGNLGGDHIIRGNEFYRTGVGNPGYAPGHNTIYNPGNRSLVEHNTFHNLANGVGIWGGTSSFDVRDVTVRYNVCYEIGMTSSDTWQQGNGSYSCVHASAIGGGHAIYRNLAYNSCDEGSTCRMFRVWRANPVQNTLDNNTVYGLQNASAAGIMVDAATAGPTNVRNNLVISAGTGITGGTQSNNITSGTPSALFTNPATYDLTLKAGSAAINAGTTAAGVVCNGTCDVGAFESIPTPAGVITANTITLTFPIAAVPIQSISTTGVTVGCTGSSCPGAPTVSAASRAVNTDTQVTVTVAGIAGNACVSTNQNWTITLASVAWTANDNLGVSPGLHQPVHDVSGLAISNQCTGSGPTGYPAGYHLYYKFDEGTGTNANDESANNLDGTLTNGPTWGAGQTGYGVVLTGNNTEHVAVPYGSGVNPSTQSLTIAFGINIPAGTESLGRQFFGAPVGTNQRLYISALLGTWQLGIQASPNGTAGNIAVTSGWHHVCLTMNSGTDTATLYIDGVASTAAGAVKSYTSYTLSGDFDLGRIADTATGGGGGTYDDLLIYQSVEDCAAISSAFHAPPPAATGTLAQAAIQFQGVILNTAGSPIVIGSAVQTIEVPAGGGVVLLFQVHCTNVADCDSTAFKLVYDKNGSGIWLQVPDIETADGTWMWGVTTDASLNSGSRSTRLTGSCAVTTGATQITSAQTPSIDLPQDGCTILAYIVRVGATQAGNYFDYKLRTAADADFTTYTQTARVRVVNPMASGIGF